jgi:nucleoid-associated protein
MSEVHLHSFQYQTSEQGLSRSPCQTDNEAMCQRLAAQLSQAFLVRSGRAFGSLDDEKEAQVFAGQLNTMLETKDLAFFADVISQSWLDMLNQGALFFPGILHVLSQEMAGEQWLYICWQEPLTLTAVNSEGELIEQPCYDTAKITVGLKFHVNDWQRGQGTRYMGLVSSKAESSVKQNFIDMIDFKAADNTRKQTEAMLDVVERYAKELPEEKQNDFRSRVIDYCEQREEEGESITLKLLADVAETEEPQAFSKFAMEHDIDPAGEWVPDRARLRSYAKFFGRDTDMSISFSTNSFGQSVEYDSDRDALVIKQIPKSLRQQLVKYLDKYK